MSRGFLTKNGLSRCIFTKMASCQQHIFEHTHATTIQINDHYLSKI
jgi:hypothetical protein